MACGRVLLLLVALATLSSARVFLARSGLPGEQSAGGAETGLKGLLGTHTMQQLLDFSESQEALALKGKVQQQWDTNKSQLLLAWVRRLMELLKTGTLRNVSVNVTIAGWQNVWNTAGVLKEINVVEFALPMPKPKGGEEVLGLLKSGWRDTEEFEDSLPTEVNTVIRGIQQPLAAMGVRTSVVYLWKDLEKLELKVQLYLDDKLVYYNNRGFVIANRTVVGNQEQIQAFLSKVRPLHSTIQVVPYKDDKVLTQAIPALQPTIITAVLETSGIEAEIELQAPSIVAEAVSSVPRDQVAKQIAIVFNQKWSQTKWRVMVSPDQWSISFDKFIKVVVDPFNLSGGQWDDVTYVIYGVVI